MSGRPDRDRAARDRAQHEQRLYLPDLGLVVILGPTAPVRGGMVATVLRIREIDPGEAGGRTHLRVRRVGKAEQEETER